MNRWPILPEAILYTGLTVATGQPGQSISPSHIPTPKNGLLQIQHRDLVPGYNIMYDAWRNDMPGPYGGPNGVYSSHGDQNAPIPYKGRVYIHRSNAIIAFGLQTPSSPLGQPLAKVVSNIPKPNMTVPTTDQLKERLADAVSETISAGHLRPGWGHSGLFDNAGRISVRRLLDGLLA